jgi:hypothetical protein
LQSLFVFFNQFSSLLNRTTNLCLYKQHSPQSHTTRFNFQRFITTTTTTATINTSTYIGSEPAVIPIINSTTPCQASM